MIRIEDITQIPDLTSVAEDFSQLLITPENTDIGKEFPGIAERTAAATRSYARICVC